MARSLQRTTDDGQRLTTPYFIVCGLWTFAGNETLVLEACLCILIKLSCQQLHINLTSNAIKFTEKGRAEVSAKREDDQLVITVSDTGKGIPEDELPTIFDEYRQVKGSDRGHKGTGLGLSITKQFAELLGGSIGVESQEGKGSMFKVKIPVRYEGE